MGHGKERQLPQASVDTSSVMDLFSGCGGAAQACRQLGLHAKVWDVKHGPLRDLTDRSVVSRVLKEICNGRVCSVTMAHFCTKFSVARDPTKVIRNHKFP